MTLKQGFLGKEACFVCYLRYFQTLKKATYLLSVNTTDDGDDLVPLTRVYKW